MERYYGHLKSLRARLACFAGAFVMSGTLLLAVAGAFYSVSSELMFTDSPEARSAVAGCDALGDRVAQQHCVRHLVVPAQAQAQAQDAGASQVATLAPHQRHAAQ
jgi:hypothetical protein